MEEIINNKGENKGKRGPGVGGNGNLIPAKKGEVRNPRGRPKGQRDYATIYREALIKIAKSNNTSPDEIENEMIANAALLARKGNYAFYKDILDRTHGQATKKVEVDGQLNISQLLDEIENNDRPTPSK